MGRRISTPNNMRNVGQDATQPTLSKGYNRETLINPGSLYVVYVEQHLSSTKSGKTQQNPLVLLSSLPAFLAAIQMAIKTTDRLSFENLSC